MSFDDGYGKEDIVFSILEGLRRYDSGSGLTKIEAKPATNECMHPDERSSDTDSRNSESLSDPTQGDWEASAHESVIEIDPLNTSLYRERLTASLRLSTTSYYFSLHKRNRESCDFVLKEHIFLNDAFDASSPAHRMVELDNFNAALWTAPPSISHQVHGILSSSTTCAMKSIAEASSSTALTSIDERSADYLGYDSCSSSITFSGSSECTSLKSCESRDDSSVSFHSFMRDGIGSNRSAENGTRRCPRSLHGFLSEWLGSDCGRSVYEPCDSDETAGTHSSGTTSSPWMG
jgi:hypothetical protein